MAIAARSKPAQNVVEEVRGNVTYPPAAGHGRTQPLVGTETSQQRKQLVQQRTEQRNRVDGSERLHQRRAERARVSGLGRGALAAITWTTQAHLRETVRSRRQTERSRRTP